MKQIAFVLIGLMLVLQANAANKFAKIPAATTVTWQTATGVWYTDSTLTTTTGYPITGDVAYIGAFSGTGTLTVGTASNTIGGFIASGYAGTFAGSGSINCNGHYKLSAAMTLTYTGSISLGGTGTFDIVTAGKTILGSIAVIAGTHRLVDNYRSTANNYTALMFTGGVFDFNNKNVTLVNGGFYCYQGLGTRTLTLGTGVLQLGYSSTSIGMYAFFMADPATLTVTATTGTIRMVGTCAFSGCGKTYGRVEWRNVGVAASPVLYTSVVGANTFSDFIVTTTGGYYGLSFLNDQTITDTCSIVGVSRVNRTLLRGKIVGAHANISAGTYIFNNVDFMGIHLTTGAAFNATALNIGNAGENENITFATPVKRFAKYTTAQTWGTTGMWSTTSGGATGASYPIPGDTAVFDQNTTAANGVNITMNIVALPYIEMKDMDNPVVFSHTGVPIAIVNKINCPNQVLSNSGAAVFYGCNIARTQQMGQTAGGSVWSPYMDCCGGAMTLINAHTGGNLMLQSGETIIGTNTTFGALNSDTRDYASTIQQTISLGSFLVVFVGNTNFFTLRSFTTFNAGTSTVRYVGGTTGADRSNTLAIAGRTFYNLEFAPTATSAYAQTFDAYNFTVSNRFVINEKQRIKFRSARTVTINHFQAIGNATYGIVISSNTTSAATLNITGSACCNYVTASYITATGKTFYGGANSTNGGNNTGITWLNCPATQRNFIIKGSTF